MHTIRKSYGPLSAGTNVDLISQDGNVSTVRLVTAPSEAFRKQNHPVVKEMGASGIFTIPTSYLIERRKRNG